MKSFISCLALTLAVTFSGLSKADNLPDLKGRTIVAVTENAYAPLNFVDPSTGKGIGWEYDAINEIARRLNAKVDWQLSSWDAMIQAVKQGQYDIGMDGITINAERAKQIQFSTPYMTSQQFMLVRADENRFFYVAVYDVLDGNESNPRITLLDTFGTSVQALKSGDVDSVLMDSTSARGYMGANPGAFKIIGGPLGSEDFGFILTPGSDLLIPINAAINSMKKDGTMEILNQKWFFDYNQK